jgi:hypothetical protein
VNVAGRHWESFLDVIPGVGTDVTAVGGGRVRSLGHGKLDIVFSVENAHGTAHVLAAPLMIHHKPYKLHYLAASHWPATPKRLNTLVASAYATVAGGSQVAYLDDNAAQAPPAAASAWASFLQGRGGASSHGSGDAAWSTHVGFVEAPTVATVARKAASAPSNKAAATISAAGAGSSELSLKAARHVGFAEAPTVAAAARKAASVPGNKAAATTSAAGAGGSELSLKAARKNAPRQAKAAFARKAAANQNLKAAATMPTTGTGSGALSAHESISRKGNGDLGTGRLKALSTAAMVVQRLNIVAPKLLKLVPTVMLGVATLTLTQRSNADEEWLQSAARQRPTAVTRTPESQRLKDSWPVGQHWSMDALPKMPHLDPRDGAGLILAELVSKLPFVIFGLHQLKPPLRDNRGLHHYERPQPSREAYLITHA